MSRTVVISFILMLVIGAAACADDGAVQGVGGAIRAMEEHPSVAMETMAVTISLDPDREARVDCHFVFHNTGPATTVRMGFPESATGEGTDVRRPRGFTSFTTWVDGKRVPVKVEGFSAHPEVSHWSRWRVKTVSFAAGQRRRVRVRYSAPLGRVSDGGRFLEYRVATGGSWKGPIVRARVQLHLSYRPEKWRVSVDPGHRTLVMEPYTWTAREYEPASDEEIQLIFVPIREAQSASDLRFSLKLALGPDEAERAVETLVHAAPGWLPPDASQYSQDALDYRAQQHLPAPWLAVGDFNGDGVKDAAVYLLRGGQMALAVLHGSGHGGFELQWLVGPPTKHEKHRIVHNLATVLQTHAPGLVAYWKEGETSPKSGRLDLKHDGIEVIELGKAAVMYYWEAEKQQYRMVQTAD